jgi:pimeloyl-ACP methyl ester carboxylesterase
MKRNQTARHAAWLLLLTALLCSCAGASPQPEETAAAGRSATLRTPDAVIDYMDMRPAGAESCRPLLLITGYAVTKEMWNPEFVRLLAAHRRVLLLDNRGMGPNSAPAGGFGIRDMARDAAALLDGLGVRQADVLGWSMGGMIAQELALNRPDLAGALILYATAPDSAELMPELDRMGAMSGPELLAAMFPPAWSREHPDAAARLPRQPRRPDLGVIARQYAAMRDWGGDVERLSALRPPVLLLAGAADWVCPPERSRRMASRIPGARLVEIPDGGHWMMHQFPAELARQVEIFLDAAAAACGPRP